MTLADEERSKYERIWTVPGYRRHSPAAVMGDEIVAHLRSTGAASVLDAGCGTGRLSARLVGEGFDVRMIDIARNCLDPDVDESIGDRLETGPLWDLDTARGRTFDAVICCDVLEHIPTVRVPDVLENITAWAPHGCLNIALYPDGFGRKIGETLHLTVRDFDWWREALALAGGSPWNTRSDGRDLIAWR